MRRKSIGATSQAFHEPMSTGARPWGRAQQLKCWSENGNPASHGTVGQVSRGLGARAPRAWGPAHQGPGAFSPQKPPKPLKLRFFRKRSGGSLAKAWVSAETAASEVGTWRETKPGYPPTPPPPTPRKEEGFHPLRLRQPSNTPPKVGAYPKPRPETLNPKPCTFSYTLGCPAS